MVRLYSARYAGGDGSAIVIFLFWPGKLITSLCRPSQKYSRWPPQIDFPDKHRPDCTVYVFLTPAWRPPYPVPSAVVCRREIVPRRYLFYSDSDEYYFISIKLTIFHRPICTAASRSPDILWRTRSAAPEHRCWTFPAPACLLPTRATWPRSLDHI